MLRSVTSVFAVLLVCACAAEPPRTSAASAVPTCRAPCRIRAEEELANPRQCVVAADCGQRSHAKTMTCDHAGFCHPFCEDHWGDCNENYVDGCEVPIDNRIYCAGDPRIDEYYPPSVILHNQRQPTGPGQFDANTFDLGLEKHRPELTRCYERALANVPTLEGAMFYQFTLDETGRIASSKLVRSELESQALQACVAELAAKVSFGERPRGGPVTFAYHVEFIAGRFNTDDE